MGSSHTYRYVSVNVTKGYTQTILYNNPDATKSWAAGTHTMNYAITNYDFVKITFYLTTAESDTTLYEAWVPVSTLQINNSKQTFHIGAKASSWTAGKVRGGYMSSSTQLYFTGSYSTTQNSQSPSSSYIIVNTIYGIKMN